MFKLKRESILLKTNNEPAKKECFLVILVLNLLAIRK